MVSTSAPKLLQEAPASELLEQLRTDLLRTQQASQGTLPLNSSTLSGTSGANLIQLFTEQYQISQFTLVTDIVIGDIVDGNRFIVTGAGQLNDKPVNLSLVFIDTLVNQIGLTNFKQLNIETLFYTPQYDDLIAIFPKLPQGFFNDILNPGTAPLVNLPLDLPKNVSFQNASYGVKGYFLPNSASAYAYLAPQIQGTITTTPKTTRTYYLELPTDWSGWYSKSIEDHTWNFDDLDWLLPTANVKSNFPGIISADQVNIRQFQLNLVPQAPSYSSLSLVVENKDDPTKPLWTAYDGKIQLTSVSVLLGLNSDNSSATSTGQGTILGAFQLGSVLLEIEIPFPLNSGVWAIQAYPNLTFKDGLDDLSHLLPGGSSFSDLMPANLDTVLSAFGLSYIYVAIDAQKLGLQNFSFSVSTTNPWTLIPPHVLELDQLIASVSVDDQAKLTGGVQGRFKIGQNDVFVSFQRYIPGGDWYFVVNSPVIALPSLGDLAQLANNTDLSPLLQASGLNSLQFLLYNLNISATIGKVSKLTGLGFTLKLATSGGTTDPQLSWEVIPGILTLNNFSLQLQLNWQPDFQADVTGFFTLNTLDFALKFGHGSNADAFIGAYSPSSQSPSQTVDIKSLISSISPTIAELVPERLNLQLKDIFIAYINVGGKGKKFVFAMDVGIQIPLTGIPLIGDALVKNANVSIEDLKIVVASDDLDVQEITVVNDLIQGLPSDMSVQPLPSPVAGETGTIVPKGFSMVAKLKLGSLEVLISAPAGSNAQIDPSAGPTPPSLATTHQTMLPRGSDPSLHLGSNYQNIMWINIQKTFGPISLDKIGFDYQDGSLFVRVNVAVNTGGLMIELLGFGIGSPLSEPQVKFDIDGLALTFEEGPIKIAGGMLGSFYPTVNFVGALTIQAEAFNLSAFGGYASLNDQPSFFLYAILNEPPLGGVPPFFVTGLAAGFGFNRSLLIPDITQIYTFPFVSWAVKNSAAPPMDPTKPISDQVANALSILTTKNVVSPKIGDYWFAGGVNFTSFELLSSFALLTVSFGNDFEIDLLGLSSLLLPPEDPEPFAEMQMELKASFSPSKGLFSIEGQLTPNSYVLSQQCRLTGGFAFYYWFSNENAGTFVVSLGGYNSNFKVPSYYPNVPRLGMNWQLSPLSITGELYFALTGNIVMAGGKLCAVWSSGPIRAWFMYWADFLMVFKPLHYYASGGMDLGASFTIHLLFIRISTTIHIGVAVAIWGPDFSGEARVDLSIISFTIGFGSRTPLNPNNTLPGGWGQFVTDLLPGGNKSLSLLPRAEATSDDTTFVHIVINDGLIKRIDNETNSPMFLVSGETFNCTIQTVIPIKKTTFKGVVSLGPMQPLNTPNTQFGAGPAGIKSDDFQPTLTVDMETSEESTFVAIRVLDNAPKSLWENKQFDSKGVPSTDTNTGLSEPSISNTLKGYQLVPVVPPPDHTMPIPKQNLEYTLDDNVQHFSSSNPTYPTSDDFKGETVADTILGQNVKQVRTALLNAIIGQQINISTQLNVADLANSDSTGLMGEPELLLLGEQKGGKA